MLKKSYLLSIFVIAFITACGSGGSSGTIPLNNSIQGTVAQGLVKDANVTAYKIDTNQSLGSANTNSDGKYTINIGSYAGSIRVISNGGSYIDEISGKELNVTTPIEAMSSITNNNQTINITPFTHIAVKQLSFSESNFSNLTTTMIEETNKQVALTIMGESFDPTKITPKILNNNATASQKITLEDGNEGKYGLMLAIFAKLTDSNSSNVQTKINEIFEDIKTDGTISTTKLDIQNALNDTNITNGADTNTTSEINTSISTIYDTNATISGVTNFVNQARNSNTIFTLTISSIDKVIPIKLNNNSLVSFSVDGNKSHYVDDNSTVVITLKNQNDYNNTSTVILQVGENNITLSSKTSYQPTTTLPTEHIFIANQSNEYNISSYFQDTDNDTLTFTIQSGALPSNIIFSNGIFSGIPTTEDINGATLTIRATDTKGDFVDSNILLKVLAQPIIDTIQAPSDIRLKANSIATLTIKFSEDLNITSSGDINITLNSGETITKALNNGDNIAKNTGLDINITAGSGNFETITISSITTNADIIGALTSQPLLTSSINQTVTNLAIDNTTPINTANTGTNTENNTTVIYSPNITNQNQNETITYSISGADSSSFDIDSATGNLTFKNPSDFETKSSYDINISATDTALNVGVTQVHISVSNVVDFAPKIANNSTTIAENLSNVNQAIVTVVKAGNFSDENITTSFRFSDNNQTTSNDGNFTITNNGEIKIAQANTIDYSVNLSHQYILKVVAFNDYNISNEANITIDITNSNSLIAYSDTVTINEDNTTILTTLLNNDTDSETRNTISIVGIASYPAISDVNITDFNDTTITIKADNNWTGNTSFSYIITNGEENSTANVQVTVQNINDIPYQTQDIANIDAILDTNSSFNILNYFSDVENNWSNSNPHQFSFDPSQPSWINDINTTAGTFSFYPTASQANVGDSIKVTATSTDANGATITDDFNITVLNCLTIQSVNTDINNTYLKAGKTIIFNIKFNNEVNISANTGDLNITLTDGINDINITSATYEANNTQDYNISVTLPSSFNILNNNDNGNALTIKAISVKNDTIIIDSNTSSPLYYQSLSGTSNARIDTYLHDFTTTFSSSNLLTIEHNSTIAQLHFEEPIYFDTTDFNNTNIEVSNKTPIGTAIHYNGKDYYNDYNLTITAKPNIDFIQNQRIYLGSFQDRADNNYTLNYAQGKEFKIDTTAPSATITSNKSQTVNIADGNVTFTITFSENINEFDINDINITGVSNKSFTTNSATTYTLEVSPNTNSTTDINISIASNIVKDENNNSNIASSLTTHVDTQTPATPTITTVANDDIINISEKANGIDINGTAENDSNVSITYNSITKYTTATNGTYTINFVTADIPNDGTTSDISVFTTDMAGNPSSSITKSITVDTDALVVNSLDFNTTTLTIGDTATITLAFNKQVKNFSNDSADINSSGGTLSTFVTTDNNTTWSATFTPTSNIDNSTHNIKVYISDIEDYSVNPLSVEFNSSNITIDTKAPTLSIASTPAPNSTNIPSDTAIEFSYSETIIDNTVKIVLVDTNDTDENRTANSTSTQNDNNRTIYVTSHFRDINGTSRHLCLGHQFYITIDTNSFKDNLNNPNLAYNGSSSWKFTTASTGTYGCSDLDNHNNNNGKDLQSKYKIFNVPTVNGTQTQPNRTANYYFNQEHNKTVANGYKDTNESTNNFDFILDSNTSEDTKVMTVEKLRKFLSNYLYPQTFKGNL